MIIFGAILWCHLLGDLLGGQRVSASAVVALALILLALAMHGEEGNGRGGSL